MSAALFAIPSPGAMYGGSLYARQPATPDDTALPAVAGPAQTSSSPLHPVNGPLFAAGVILAGAVGLAFLSTNVRVGPIKASASLGKS